MTPASQRLLPDPIGSRGVTALVADRIVRETLTGVAQRRRAARAGQKRLAVATAT
jgi:hypothetical protein